MIYLYSETDVIFSRASLVIIVGVTHGLPAEVLIPVSVSVTADALVCVIVVCWIATSVVVNSCCMGNETRNRMCFIRRPLSLL